MSKTVAFYTLGCKLNFAETSDLSRKFIHLGYQVVDFKEQAHVYVINTCTVTAMAEKKGRSIIRQAIQLNPNAIVAVIGCFSTVRPEEIAAIEGVDFILSNADKHLLPEYIEDHLKQVDTHLDLNTFVPSYSFTDRTRIFFKIQDGCDYFCHYCAVPYARGQSRSLSVADTIATAKEIAQTGIQEMILSGVNIGDFGRKNGENFFQLVEALENLSGIKRIRISSVEPNLLTDDIIKQVSHSQKFLPHFHIPLQSGCNKILQLMKRRYQREVFAERVQFIKNIMPHACVAADVIVGFPGETVEDFMDTYHFLESLPISMLHVFPYSIRPGTPAAQMSGQVDTQEKQRRSKKLIALSQEKKQFFYHAHAGHHSEVLWESEKLNEQMFGFTENYIKVKKPYDEKWVNTIENITLTHEMMVSKD